jgi:hypothetical protein
MTVATVKIIEGPNRSLVVTVESRPPLPLKNGRADLDRCDCAQAAALYAAQMLGEAGDDGHIRKVVAMSPVSS